MRKATYSASLRAFFEASAQGQSDFANGVAEDMGPEMMAALERCESPIEAKLLGAMRWASFGYNPHGPLSIKVRDAFEPAEGESAAGNVWIIPQHKVGNFTVDFMLYAGDRLGGWVFVALECDGHDFHERTKEQAAHDRSRDRILAGMGVVTLRFTGSEIWQDARQCVLHIADVVTLKIEERLSAAGVTFDRFGENCVPPSCVADHYGRWDTVLGESEEHPRPRFKVDGGDQ